MNGDLFGPVLVRPFRGDTASDAVTSPVTEGNYVIGGQSVACGPNKLVNNDQYVIGADTWSARAALGCPARMSHASVTVAAAYQQIIVTGGIWDGGSAPNNTIATTSSYAPDYWIGRKPMIFPSPNADHVAFTFPSGGSAIVAGGGNVPVFGPVRFPHINEYRPNNDAWASWPNRLRDGVEGAAVFVVEDAAWVSGGDNMSNAHAFLNRVVYDSTIVKNTIDGGFRTGHAAFAIGDDGYIVGGAPNVSGSGGRYSSTYKYVVSSDSWNQVASLLPGRQNFAAVGFKGSGWSYGGTVDPNGVMSDEHREYNPALDTWGVRGPMAHPARENHSVSKMGAI